MSGIPVTFADLRMRAFKKGHLIGGHVEIRTAYNICRGRLENLWWRKTHLQRIKLDDGEMWNDQWSTWDKGDEGIFSFPFKDQEYFIGPYVMESGEIFFQYRTILAVTIFPMRFEPPEVPSDVKAYLALHEKTMGLDNVKTAV